MKKIFLFITFILVFFLFNTCKKKCEDNNYTFTEDELSWIKYNVKGKYLYCKKDTIDLSKEVPYSISNETSQPSENPCTTNWQKGTQTFDFAAKDTSYGWFIVSIENNISFNLNINFHSWISNSHGLIYKNSYIFEQPTFGEIMTLNKTYKNVMMFNFVPEKKEDIIKFFFVKGIGVIYLEFKNGKTFELIE